MAGQKLIEGNITIEDQASKALSDIEKALLEVTKVGQKTTETIKGLNRELSKTKVIPQTADGTMIGTGSRSRRRSVGTTVAAADVARARKETAGPTVVTTRDISTMRREEERTRVWRAQDRRLESELTVKRVKADSVAVKKTVADAEVVKKKTEKNVTVTSSRRTDWQQRMDRLAAKNGLLRPLWESMGKATTPMNTARSPHLITEGLMDSFMGMGRIGRGIGGLATGRMIGSMFGSEMAGGLIGSAAGGPIGLAIGAAATLVVAGLGKLSERVDEIREILNEIATERARESTELRRKMQMSYEMFGVDPRNIRQIDEKIYAMRGKELEMYRGGLPGRDITKSAVEWLHLLGTKDSGGTFANEAEAFDFSKALAAISKMNGLSKAEYETVRYQGMQILSKGYADILDIKPLLNSAPGFVRDLLQQTGMSRKQLLESGRTREFTSDKFINALKAVEDYYVVLADRASSRTEESQKEAADNIIGSAAIWDEMYKKAKAESNMAVANAEFEAGIINDIKRSWFEMWSETGSAEDGVKQFVEWEKQLTYDILDTVLTAYENAVIFKNELDGVYNTAVLIADKIKALFYQFLNAIRKGLLDIVSSLSEALPENETLSALKNKLAEADSVEGGEKRMVDAMTSAITKKLREDELASGADYVAKKYSDILPDEIRKGVWESKQIPMMEYVEPKNLTVSGTIASVIPAVGVGKHLYEGDYGKAVMSLVPGFGVMNAMSEYGLQEKGGYYKKSMETVNRYNKDATYNVKDMVLFGGDAERKRTGKMLDEKELSYNVRKYIVEPALKNGSAKLSGGATPEVFSDKTIGAKALASASKIRGFDAQIHSYDDSGKLIGKTNALDYFGFSGDKNKSSYWTGDAIVGRMWDEATEKFNRNAEQDRKDMERVREQVKKTREAAQAAAQNVHSPYIPKIAKDVNDMKNGKGKGTNAILDILKEIAGVTVINKVTKVRPDVVFNFGSYGRSGKNEDPNLVSVGDTEQLAAAIMSLMDTSDTSIEVMKNGATVALA